MYFEKKFNKTCGFPNYIEDLPDTLKKAEKNVRKKDEEYAQFRKKHGLENLYFSEIVDVKCFDTSIIEVTYKIQDLYLTYLDANGMYPEGTTFEVLLLREQYLYNTHKEWLFRDSMSAALERQDAFIKMGECRVSNSSMYVGITERIKLSDPSNGLPGMIIDRIPMTYEDLIEK